MAGFFKRNDCRLCKSLNMELVMHIASTPVGDDFIPPERLDKAQNVYPLELYYCHGCGLLQLPGILNPETIYRNYLYETSASLGLKAHFQNYADSLMSRINPNEESLVIDIGSNDGTLLKCFKNSGMQVLGIEPAIDIATKVTESGVETIPDFFSSSLACQIKKEREPASIITANNVFANIDDLDNMIAGVRELLAPDGVFVFETGYMVDLIQNIILDNVYHEHLCYFSVKPLVKFFSSHGLEMIDIERVPTKGGSIRGVVQLKGGPRNVSPSVSGLMTLETELGFNRITPFRSFVDRVENIREKLNRLLLDLKVQGKNIAGYGASVGVTTLLYFFNLGDTIKALYDDNLLRCNLFSPGHHIPVLSSEEIYKEDPDYVVILAWRYAEVIIKKHETFLKQKGHFILPLPDVTII